MPSPFKQIGGAIQNLLKRSPAATYDQLSVDDRDDRQQVDLERRCSTDTLKTPSSSSPWPSPTPKRTSAFVSAFGEHRRRGSDSRSVSSVRRSGSKRGQLEFSFNLIIS